MTSKQCRQIESIWRMGPRVVGELIQEIADPADIDNALDQYARLNGDFIRALGGDQFPPAPIYEVPR